MLKASSWKGLILALFPSIGFVIWSYTQTDPNLVLSSNALYWSFQQWMWQLGYHHRAVSSLIYMILVVGMFGSYLWVIRWKEIWKRRVFAGTVFLFLFAYPALSHDVFNYIFNARMVVQYQENPHTTVALEFSDDLWTRFMRNTHTAAPYGYGWTLFSIPQYLLGFGKFTLTLASFKMFSAVTLVIFVVLLRSLLRSMKKPDSGVWLVALHPLVFIEFLAVMHNDLWMMAFALAMLLATMNKKTTLAVMFLVLSISIKFVTILMTPLLFLWMDAPAILKKSKSFAMIFGWLHQWWQDLLALGLLVPLLTARSQWFHPWYLIWALTWYPLIRSQLLRAVLFGLSISSLFRYVPYFWQGEFLLGVFETQIIITWFGGVTLALIWYRMRSCRVIARLFGKS